MPLDMLSDTSDVLETSTVDSAYCCQRPATLALSVANSATPLSDSSRKTNNICFSQNIAQTTFETVWPSDLRRWLQAPVRKGVGSNPTAVTFPRGGAHARWGASRSCTALRWTGAAVTWRIANINFARPRPAICFRQLPQLVCCRCPRCMPPARGPERKAVFCFCSLIFFGSVQLRGGN